MAGTGVRYTSTPCNFRGTRLCRNWEQVIPLFVYPPEVRRTIYTTNAIERLHSQVRRSMRARGHLPTDEAAAFNQISRTRDSGIPIESSIGIHAVHGPRAHAAALSSWRRGWR